MIITIPTYRRPEAILKKTLRFLERMRVDPSEVHIFVADEDELMDYQLSLGTRWYDRVFVSAPTLAGSRNAIYDYFPKGTEILMMDDDVRELVVRHKGITMKTPRREQGHYITPAEFRALCKKGFALCHKHKATLWGVYPTNNPSHMRDRVWVGLSYIVGAFFGVINTKDRSVYGRHPIKEDYERTLRHYVRDGKVVRIDNVGVDTVYFGGHGGLHSEGLEARHQLANTVIDKLLSEFPAFCKEHIRPTYRDIKLNRHQTT